MDPMKTKADEALVRLTKFVDVMRRKFVRPGSDYPDDFLRVETGSPDEAECRVSDIEELLKEYEAVKQLYEFSTSAFAEYQRKVNLHAKQRRDLQRHLNRGK